MKLFKRTLSIVALLVVSFMEARVASAPARERKIIDKPQIKAEPKLSMENYAQNKVLGLQQNLVDDIFPKKATIERLVHEFKDEYPGPNKLSDTTMLYNAIINNPEIKKFLTLENATGFYRFVKETISSAWDKEDNLVWSR